MKRELANRQREEQAEAETEAEVDEKAEIDSIDSLYAHVVLSFKCETSTELKGMRCTDPRTIVARDSVKRISGTGI